MKLKIRRLLKGMSPLGPSVSLTLVKLNRWAISIQSGDIDELDRLLAGPIPAYDLIANIAESLVEQPQGIDHDLLSKSLQEALLYCIGIDIEIDQAELKTRLVRCVETRGASFLVVRFLSLCIFNFVWSQISEPLRAMALGVASFEMDMENVELACESVVASCWRSYAARQHELDPRIAGELVRNIEQQLVGWADQVPAHDSTEQVRRLQRLLDATLLLNSSLSLKDLTEIILEIVRADVPVERVTAFRVDHERQQVQSLVAQETNKTIQLPIGSGIAGTVAATGAELDIPDAYADSRFNPNFDSILNFHTKDLLALPVFNREGTVVGVLELMNRQRPINESDLAFLRGISTYVGLALENAWLYEQALSKQEIEDR